MGAFTVAFFLATIFAPVVMHAQPVGKNAALPLKGMCPLPTTLELKGLPAAMRDTCPLTLVEKIVMSLKKNPQLVVPMLKDSKRSCAMAC